MNEIAFTETSGSDGVRWSGAFNAQADTIYCINATANVTGTAGAGWMDLIILVDGAQCFFERDAYVSSGARSLKGACCFKTNAAQSVLVTVLTTSRYSNAGLPLDVKGWELP